MILHDEIFFFSSRRRHTRSLCDWSSDVCSSDLLFMDAVAPGLLLAQGIGRIGNWFNQELYGKETTLPWGLKIDDHPGTLYHRSEERRVGKECRSRKEQMQ